MLNKRNCVVSLSGGMDSATALYWARDTLCDGNPELVEALSFSYGSKHGEYELHAARRIAAEMGVGKHNVLDMRGIGALLESDLLKSGGDIPEGHYEAENMKRTVVPGRNIIFASIAAARAMSLGARFVVMGIHAGDQAIYPDCRPEFFHDMRKAIFHGTGGEVSLAAPFLFENKEGILNQGIPKGVPYHMTRTCYKNQPIACGKCGACQERLEAFKNIGAPDPVEYEGD